MNNDDRHVMFSRKTEDWMTPPEIYNDLNREFKFITDPCTTADNPLNARVFYTKEENGLRQIWVANCFVNPPYGKDINEWLAKGREHVMKSGCIVVFLLPARTDTKWFHRWCYNIPNVEIRFYKGRIKFAGVSEFYKRNSAPFPSMLVIMRP